MYLNKKGGVFMTRVKRRFAISIALMMALGLCACGNSAENKSTDSTSSTEQTVTGTNTGDTSDTKDEGRPGNPPGDPPEGSPGGSGGPGGAPGGGSSSSDITYSGAAMISSADTQSGQNYSSSTSDESALLVSTSDDVTITDPTVTKSGD